MMRVIILLAVVAVALAELRQGHRIVGGTPTTVAEYPYMTNMQLVYLGIIWMQACGGALLTTRTVLSAAHCYYQRSPSTWRVRVGTSYASSGGSVHEVSSFTLHENYVHAILLNDVAIVHLATGASLSSTVGTARIAGTNYNIPDGTRVTAIGWGALNPGGSFPEQLQHVRVNIINQQLCAERYAYLKTQAGYQGWPDVTAGMICSGILDEGGRDGCQGDSGGPVIYSGDIIVGITSWGFECAHEFYPGVNVRVSYYSDWIRDNGSW